MIHFRRTQLLLAKRLAQSEAARVRGADCSEEHSVLSENVEEAGYRDAQSTALRGRPRTRRAENRQKAETSHSPVRECPSDLSGKPKATQIHHFAALYETAEVRPSQWPSKLDFQ